ncbi:carboxymuconolactone decarboxylase family protein [Arthrobacter pigmenti]|nr:carboxymuconolactone decarboxylase family protein [Arthrobacter pigmenti]
MSSRLPLLHPENMTADQRSLYNRIAAGPRANGPFRIMHDDATLAGPFNALAHAPLIGDAVQELGSALRFKGKLQDRTRELVICAVAAALNSEYEWYAHSRAAVVVGVTEEELTQLKAGTIPQEASDAEKSALKLTRELIAEAGIPDSTFEDAQQHLGHEGTVEVTVLVGYYRTLAGLLAVANVKAPEDQTPEDTTQPE